MSPWGQNIYSKAGHPNPQSPVRDDIFKKSGKHKIVLLNRFEG